MDVAIISTAEEKEAVLNAIVDLNAIQHLRYMSQAMIAESSGVKETKVRAVLADLLAEQAITQIKLPGSRQVPRYYYVITDIGAAYIND